MIKDKGTSLNKLLTAINHGVYLRRNNSLSSGQNVLLGEHFIHRIAIYPLGRVIHYLNNQGQNAQVREEMDRGAKLPTLCERR